MNQHRGGRAADEMRRRIGRIARFGAALTLAASLYLLLWPNPLGSHLAPSWVGHLALFVILGGWLALAAAASSAPTPIRWGTALFVGAIFAITTEVAQGYTGRDPEFADAVLDVAGTALGLGLGYASWLALNAFFTRTYQCH